MEIRQITRDNIADVAKREGHKFDHGHVLVAAGGAGKTGAARLSARGALRIGAGLVTLAAPGSSFLEIATRITELMLLRVGSAEDLVAALGDPRINTLCLGPGLGTPRARELVPSALAARRATVLDADALSAFAPDPQALFADLHPDCVLTPHGGEFARLFPDLADDAALANGPAARERAVCEAADRCGAVVLLKGATTFVARPGGKLALHQAEGPRAVPWLATAGSGDVLAGFIAGLMARGIDAGAAAETAAWLHVECARVFGPGLVAGDLPETLPQVLRTLAENDRSALNA